MEARTKAFLVAALIVTDGLLTWGTILAGKANGHEFNPLFQDTQPLTFPFLGIIKASLWIGVWILVRNHPKSGVLASGLFAFYGGLCLWNLGNLAINL